MQGRVCVTFGFMPCNSLGLYVSHKFWFGYDRIWAASHRGVVYYYWRVNHPQDCSMLCCHGVFVNSNIIIFIRIQGLWGICARYNPPWSFTPVCFSLEDYCSLEK